MHKKSNFKINLYFISNRSAKHHCTAGEGGHIKSMSLYNLVRPQLSHL